MQATPERDSFHVRRLTSTEEFSDVARAILRGAEPLYNAREVGRGLAIVGAEGAVLAAGIHRSGTGIRELSISPVVTTTAAAESTPGAAAAVSALLRELFFDEPHWHVLRIAGAPGVVIDTCWRFAARLGYACSVTQRPPPVRTREGVTLHSPPTLSVYATGIKGRWAQLVDAGVSTALHAVVRAQLTAFTGRFRRSSAPETGSRFFVLDLASVPTGSTWGEEVSFREVPPNEASAHPLDYGTSIERVEQALRRGDRCFATLVNGELAHHHWVSTDRDFLNRMLPGPITTRPTAHPFGAYTFPAYRGQGLQAATHRWLARVYRREGIEQFAVRVSSFNQASIRGVLKAGYQERSAANDAVSSGS